MLLRYANDKICIQVIQQIDFFVSCPRAYNLTFHANRLLKKDDSLEISSPSALQ